MITDGTIVELKDSISSMKRVVDQKARNAEDLNSESERLREEKSKQSNIGEKKDAEIRELNGK
jgi:predicted RNase H-like nuclease (RuvC/YqgF family)